MKFKSLLIFPLLVTHLQAATVDDLTFTLINGDSEYRVSSCDQNASGSLDIPSSNNDLPVTSIGSGAFFFCTSLTSITIPDSVTSIGIAAFSDCSSLTSITIPDSVNSIGRYAFSYCTSLTSITIPDSITSIGERAFYGCSGLTSIRFDGVAPTIGTDVFDYIQTPYILIKEENIESYGGLGATFGDLIVVEPSKFATAANLYSIDDIQDLRAGSTMIEIQDGQAILTMEIEQSDDLGIWTNGGASTLQIPIDAEAGKKFFRFKMAE